MVDALCPGSQIVVETGFARVVSARGEDAVGDRTRDEDISHTLYSQASDVSIGVERPARPGQREADDRVALERWGRGLGGDRRVLRDVRLDPRVRDDARVGAREA